MDRRTFVCALSSGGLAAVAGCSSVFPTQKTYESGEIAIIIDDTPVDLTADRFQAEYADEYALEFHLHEHDDRWYNDRDERLELAEGIDALPHITYEYGDEQVLTVDDETYDETTAGTAITFLVDGEPVEPTAHTITDGDDIRVEVETAA